MKKGYRTVTYNAIKAAIDSGIFAVLLNMDWQTAGFTPKAAVWVALALSLADKGANIYLRFITSTAVGKAE